MKPIAAEWVGKAEGDFTLMEREGRVRKNPVYDGVCFHAQHAVAYRYPGESATREEAKDAIRRCRRFRQAARLALEIRA